MFILRKTCTCSFMLFLSRIHISSLVAGRMCLLLTSAILFQYGTHSYPLLTMEDIGYSKFLSIRHISIVVAFNPLNAKLNPICHLLALIGAHHILHVSRIRVNELAVRRRPMHKGHLQDQTRPKACSMAR